MPSEIRFQPRNMRGRLTLDDMLGQSTCCMFANPEARATLYIYGRGTWAALLATSSGADCPSATDHLSEFAKVPTCVSQKTLEIKRFFVKISLFSGIASS